ncbi:MAG: hypothetical protein J4A00_00535 [Gammaproteobacteria bacterium]|nr:hypothetical protein [Gammaproteobacteria bacterium]
MLTLTLLLSLAGCSTQADTPSEVAEAYWAAILAGDEVAATALTARAEAAPQSNFRRDMKIDTGKIEAIRFGEEIADGNQTSVVTIVSARMETSGGTDGNKPLEVTFGTQLVKEDGEWRVAPDRTNQNMMGAALQVAMGATGQAIASGMQQAMEGLGEAMAEGLQSMVDGLSEGLSEVAPVSEPATPAAPWRPPEVSSAQVSGTIQGTPVALTRVEWNNTLAIYSGNGWGSNPSLLLFLFLDENELPADRTITVEAAAGGFNNPHIHYRWRDPQSGKIDTRVLTRDYDLTLKLGTPTDGRVPGDIRFSVPGESTELRGSFEIERPAPD